METRSKEHIISLTNSFVKLNARKKAITDTHREKAYSNRTPALTKSMNMDIWVVGRSNQPFLRDF